MSPEFEMGPVLVVSGVLVGAGAVGGILSDGAAGGERDRARRLVHIGDGQREGLGGGEAALVGDADGDGMRGRGLVIEQAARSEGRRAGDGGGGGAAAGSVGQR